MNQPTKVQIAWRIRNLTRMKIAVQGEMESGVFVLTVRESGEPGSIVLPNSEQIERLTIQPANGNQSKR